MSRKQHIYQFSGMLMFCVVLILILEPPNRNMISVIWGLIGFAQYGYRYWRTWTLVSADLIDNHSAKLKIERITYRNTSVAKVTDIWALLSKEKELKMYSAKIGEQVGLIRLYIHLTGIAFLAFGMMGVLTVVLTW